jgi:hypothetical protein
MNPYHHAQVSGDPLVLVIDDGRTAIRKRASTHARALPRERVLKAPFLARFRRRVLNRTSSNAH